MQAVQHVSNGGPWELASNLQAIACPGVIAILILLT